MEWFPRLAVLVGPCACLGAGCGLLLGFSDDYRLMPDQVGDAGSPDVPMDAGLDAPADSAVPDAMLDGGHFTMPAGKLVYHRYTDYFTGDSEMFIVDFPSGTRSAEIGATYGLCNPLNGIFSPDGKQLVLGALPRTGDGCPATNVNELEIYILDLEQPGTKRQVTMNALEDQDPQFSFDGGFLVFKHDGHIAEWPVGAAPFTACDALAPAAHCYSSANEQSKPVITPDDATICYYEGHFEESDVYCFDRIAGQTSSVDDIKKPAAVHRNVNDYRPMVDETHLYYVRGRSVTDPVTYIARTPLSNLSTVSEMAPFCRDVTVNYDDPCTLGGDLLVYSSDQSGQGQRDLFVTDFAGHFVYSLDDFSPGLNSPKLETGPDFWRAPP